MLGFNTLSFVPLSTLSSGGGGETPGDQTVVVNLIDVSTIVDESTYLIREVGHDDPIDPTVDVDPPSITLTPALLSVPPIEIEVITDMDGDPVGTPASQVPPAIEVTVAMAATTITPGTRTIDVPPVIVNVAIDRPTVESTVVCEDGRRRIAVDQEPGGDNYPFSEEPSSDIKNLIADFYLGYEGRDCPYVYPLRIDWLYGLGETNNEPLPGNPTPTHYYDLVVKDAEDTTVFDSTTADWFQSRAWGTRLMVAEWRTDTAVCRLVFHTCWDPDLIPEHQYYDQYIEPVNAPLDARTLEEWPRRLTAITIETEEGNVTTNGRSLKLQAGYNIEMVAEAVEALQGAIAATELEIAAIPGAGTGQYPGCADTVNTIRTIGGVAPDKNGNFILDTGDRDGAPSCYRISVPSEVVNEVPRTVQVTPNTLSFANDCDPCCQCSQFEAVYNAITRLHDRYVALARRAGCVRDQYEANRTRWIEVGRERLSKPLRLAVMPGDGCLVEIAGAYCNNTDSCIDDLELRFTIDSPSAGVIVCGKSYRSGNTVEGEREGGCVSPSTLERYEMVGDMPQPSGFFDRVTKGGMAYIRFQVQFSDGLCSPGDQLTVNVRAYINDIPITYNSGWPGEPEETSVDAVIVSSEIFITDPCSITP